MAMRCNNRVRDRLAAGSRTRSRRFQVVGLLYRANPRCALGLGAWSVAGATLPVATLVVVGAGLSNLPAATAQGLDSPAGRSLLVAVVAGTVLFSATLLLGPVQAALAVSARVVLGNALRQRLIAAVSQPVGVEHLEEPELLGQLVRAQGTLASQFPADAPAALASIVATRAAGVLACLVLTGFRWWLGPAVLISWLLARRPLRMAVLGQVAVVGGEPENLRRAGYFLRLATGRWAAPEIRVFGLSTWVVEQFRSRSRAGAAQVRRHRARIRRTTLVVAAGVAVVHLAAALAIGGAAISGEIALGTMTVLLLLLGMSSSVATMTYVDIGLELMLGALPELDAIEARARKTTAAPITARRSAQGMPQRTVRFEGVSFGYAGRSAPVLEGLDLSLAVCRSNALVGLNGSGKTTIVKLLCQLQQPQSGRIVVDDTPLADLHPSSWRSQIAVVFQAFNRYPFSLRENVGFGALRHLDDTAAIGRSVRRAAVTGVVEGLPEGLDTSLAIGAEDGCELSGGQWQRVALARALFAIEHGARLLILDEPTAWLDARGEAAFFEQFLEITRGVTTLVISHRFSTVRRAEHIHVLGEGRIAEHGSHDELMTRNGRYASMFRMQALRFAPASGEVVVR
jgi:ATP-binding cassette subfamily B protein